MTLLAFVYLVIILIVVIIVGIGLVNTRGVPDTVLNVYTDLV